MKLTEIVWEDGRKYVDCEGIVWEVIYTCGTLMGTVDGKVMTIEQLYHLRDLLRIELQEVVDWSKVEVDTKVTVWNTDFDSFKRKRYFAKYEDGLIYVFGDGRTSWNALDENDLTAWDCGELVE